MQLTLSIPRKRVVRAACGRAVRWLAAFALVLQLIAIGHHNHDLEKNPSDCISCYLTAHYAGNAPTVAPALPVIIVTYLYLAALPELQFFFRSPRFLIPHSQAPPEVRFAA